MSITPAQVMCKIRVVLLSGGSGSRLWPLSNSTRSKQFIKFLKSPNGGLESMCQRVVRQLIASGIAFDITIVTGKSQVETILNQVGPQVDVIAEPERRDTFPAIAFAVSYLALKKKCDKDDVVVVMPIDSFVEDDYFKTIGKIGDVVVSNIANIVLIGIYPESPSKKFGYILPEKGLYGQPSRILSFKEKPDKEEAQRLIENGALWNAGVFAFKAGYMLKILSRYISFDSFSDMGNKYSMLPKKSFDFEILEKESSVAVLPFKGKWKDIGTWNSLSEEIENSTIGNVLLADSTDTSVVNELDIPLVCVGAKNLIIAASFDGIFVGDKEKSVFLKDYIGRLGGDLRPMYEERRFGECRVLSYCKYEDGSEEVTRFVRFNNDAFSSRQRRLCCDVILTFVHGEGVLTLNDKAINVKKGDVVKINAGEKYALKSTRSLQIVEVQIGAKLTDDAF